MRLIDADALKESLTETLHRCDKWIENAKDEEIRRIAEANYTAFLESILRVKGAPTIDAVPVVRCKDCKYWGKDTLRHNSNDVAEWDECECEMLANRDGWNEIDRYCCDVHFCADGERKDNE